MVKRIILLNGFAILAVVLSHAAGWGQIAMINWADRYSAASVPDYSQINSLAYFVLFIVRQVTSFAVPAFIFTSGYFSAFSLNGVKSLAAGYRKLWPRLMWLFIPYTLWSACIFLYNHFLHHMNYTAFEIVKAYFTEGAIGSYYFIPLVGLLYLLAPLLALAMKKNTRLVVILSLAASLLPVVVTYLAFVGNLESGLITFLYGLTPSWSVIRWIFFMVLGMAFFGNLKAFKEWLTARTRMIVVVTVVFGVLALVEPEVMFRARHIDFRFLPQLLSNLVYALGMTMCILLAPVEKLRFNRQLAWAGSHSMSIFLAHMFTMEVVGRFFYHFMVPMLTLPLLLMVIYFAAGLLAPVLLMILLQRSPFKKAYPYVFG